jgi:hypothetical protein
MKPRTLVVMGAIFLAAFSRLLPLPPNVAPITALALFGGACLADRSVALLATLLAMLLSDLGIETLHRLKLTDSWGIYPTMWVNYSIFLLITCLGFVVRRHRTVPAVAGATLVSALFFFAVSNFAVWAAGILYPRTPEGLAACYTAAIPFFRNTLMGDCVFATALFGGFALLERWLPVLREQPVPAATQAS